MKSAVFSRIGPVAGSIPVEGTTSSPADFTSAWQEARRFRDLRRPCGTSRSEWLRRSPPCANRSDRVQVPAHPDAVRAPSASRLLLGHPEQAHPMAKILRTWTFWIRTELRQEAHAYLEAGRLQEMRAAPGNRRVSAVFRERQDGTTAVVIMSIWDSLESIRALVGSDHDQPWIAPEELARVFDSDNKVGHYSLSDASVRELLPPEWCEEIA